MVSSQADMLPTEWSDMFDYIRRRGDAFAIVFGERRFEKERAPVDDGVY